MLIVFNLRHGLVTFTIPACPGRELVPAHRHQPARRGAWHGISNDSYDITRRSLLLFTMHGRIRRHEVTDRHTSAARGVN